MFMEDKKQVPGSLNWSKGWLRASTEVLGTTLEESDLYSASNCLGISPVSD